MNKLAIGLLTIFCACKSTQRDTSNEVLEAISVNEIVVEQLGQKYERKDNGDFSLCFTINKTPGIERKTVLVLNNQTGEVIYGPTKLNADIDWYTERQLIIKEYPEVIQDKHSNKTFVYYYDLVDRKKITH